MRGWASNRFVAPLAVGVLLFMVVGIAHAGPFSRARTEGHRLDEAGTVVVEGIYIYSFLQDGAESDKRLASDLDRYLEAMTETLQAKGIRVGMKGMPVGTLSLVTTPRGVKGIEGFERVLAESSKTTASEVAREHRDQEAALSAGYRLLLLPDKVIRNSGLQWGSRMIRTGSGTMFTHGAHVAGVPSYSYRVYWLLEDVDDRPVAAGTTTGTLDIRGFPAKPMIEQMIEELEGLKIKLGSDGPR